MCGNASVKMSGCIATFVEELSRHVSRMARMTKTGRVYERGRALNNDLRRNIIRDIVENGGGNRQTDSLFSKI